MYTCSERAASAPSCSATSLASSSFIPSTSIIRSSSKVFDNDYLYKYLSQQIESSDTYSDLQKFIEHLIPIDVLKQILLKQLLQCRIDTQVHRQKPDTHHHPDHQERKSVSDDADDEEGDHGDDETRPTNAPPCALQWLYLSCAPMEELFSDDVLVNMIRFLPSSHYAMIPCISRNFRAIMKKYPIIYKQYTVHIALDNSLLANDGVLWIAINHHMSSIRIIHRYKHSLQLRNDSLSVRRELEEAALLSDAHTVHYEVGSVDDILYKVPFLWYCCKKWHIQSVKKLRNLSWLHSPNGNRTISFVGDELLSHQSMQSVTSVSSRTSPRYGFTVDVATPTTDARDRDKASSSSSAHARNTNNLFASIVNKSVNFIESLCLDNITDKDGAKWHILNNLKLYKALNHICINQSVHHSILQSWMMNTTAQQQQQLRGIQYLEFNGLQHDCLVHVKRMLEVMHDLIVFDCCMASSSAPVVIGIGNRDDEETEKAEKTELCIAFPARLQFIRLQGIGDAVEIDLSRCTDLCGVYLCDWPSVSTALQLFGNDHTAAGEAHSADFGRTACAPYRMRWPQCGGIECLLLEQQQADDHDMSAAQSTMPCFINDWYHLLLNHASIPVRTARFITHPFVSKPDTAGTIKQSQSTQSTCSDMDPEDEELPEPPSLMPAIQVMPVGSTLLAKHDDACDALKCDVESEHFISLEQLQQLSVDDEKTSSELMYTSPIRILKNERDLLYRGYLWELLLRMKYTPRHTRHEHIKTILSTYRNWFEIGVGHWIRECGTEVDANAFTTASLKFLNPYSNPWPNRSSRPSGW